jgi:myo-inositol-1(or 4)-monophosphatase
LPNTIPLNIFMKNLSPALLLDTAICAAEAAGIHAMENKDRRTETTETFSHDLKLVLDMECQKIAEEVIAREFPSHNILGEEDVRQNSAAAYEWIIDPIDGTMNYTHNFPYWCSSVAVRHNGKVVAGCVYAPESNDVYMAHIDGPAQHNGDPISVSTTGHLKDAIIFTGLSKHMVSSDEPHFEMFETLALNSQKVRINGAAALDLCHVACGSGDGYFETSIYLWDHAAAGLIAERSGAVLALYPENHEPHGCTVLCANKNLIDDLRAIYTKCI